MNELIKVTYDNDRPFVSARELHGTPVAKLNYQPDMAYACARQAIGRKQGRVAWYASKDKLTPEELRDRLAGYGWDEAMMLDARGSTIFWTRSGGWYCDPTRVLYSYIVFTLAKKAAPRPTTTGAAGLALIKQFEGCRLKAYKPFAYEQYWTIGWGHYGADVTKGQTITQAQADAMHCNIYWHPHIANFTSCIFVFCAGITYWHTIVYVWRENCIIEVAKFIAYRTDKMRFVIA